MHPDVTMLTHIAGHLLLRASATCCAPSLQQSLLSAWRRHRPSVLRAKPSHVLVLRYCLNALYSASSLHLLLLGRMTKSFEAHLQAGIS